MGIQLLTSAIRAPSACAISYRCTRQQPCHGPASSTVSLVRHLRVSRAAPRELSAERGADDVKMEESDDSAMDDDNDDRMSRARSDVEDGGVFAEG